VPRFLPDEDAAQSSYRVHVCLGPNCSARGSKALLTYLEDRIWELGLQRSVEVIGTSCRDRCDWGPSMNVYPGPVLYNEFDHAALDCIVSEHLSEGRVVEQYLFRGKPRR
jgi:(2Fe-2S) ferredoxin